MATLIPSITTCKFDSPGERRFARLLEAKLEDDYLCWFNVPIGPARLHPDFIILHPQHGIREGSGVRQWGQARLSDIREFRGHASWLGSDQECANTGAAPDMRHNSWLH